MFVKKLFFLNALDVPMGDLLTSQWTGETIIELCGKMAHSTLASKPLVNNAIWGCFAFSGTGRLDIMKEKRLRQFITPFQFQNSSVEAQQRMGYLTGKQPKTQK